MRTTISLAEQDRETLLTIAKGRGEKGVSRVVEEAVAFYLAQRSNPAQLVELAPPPELGRWQRIGADLDQQMGEESGVLALLRALVRGGLRRLPILRA